MKMSAGNEFCGHILPQSRNHVGIQANSRVDLNVDGAVSTETVTMTSLISCEYL